MLRASEKVGSFLGCRAVWCTGSFCPRAWRLARRVTIEDNPSKAGVMKRDFDVPASQEHAYLLRWLPKPAGVGRSCIDDLDVLLPWCSDEDIAVIRCMAEIG